MRILSLILFLASCSAEAATTRAGKGPTFFHDKMLRSKLETEGEKLINNGRFTAAKELRTQLSRKKAQVDLAEPRATDLTLADLVKRRQSGVLIITGLYKCGRCDRWHSGAASAVSLTADGIFATCHHVIARTNHHAFFVMTVDGRVAPVVEVLAADAKADIAICRAAGIKLNPVPLAVENPPVGSSVSVISHPSGNHYTLTTGIISRYFFKPVSKTRSTPAMAITAEFAKGSSGGPVMDAAGNVVGLVAATHSIYYRQTEDKQENLQMVTRHCVPLSAIRELIDPETH